MRYRLFEENVVKDEFERPGPQEVGKSQQNGAERGNRKPAFHFHQMFANNPVEPSSSVLTHQLDTSTGSPNRRCASCRSSGRLWSPCARMRLTARNARSAN